MRFDVIEITA